MHGTSGTRAMVRKRPYYGTCASLPSTVSIIILLLAPRFVEITGRALQQDAGTGDHPPNGLQEVPAFAETSLYEGRIVGGTEAPKGRFSFMVNVADEDGDIFCGGSLISPSVVLSAAHCKKAIAKVFIGRHDLNDDSETFEEINVEEIIPHPDHKKYSGEYDFLILKLQRKSSIGTPVLLDHPGSSDGLDLPLHADKEQILVPLGWGDTEQDGENSPVLLETRVAYVSNTVCGDIYWSGMIFDSMLCAHTAGQDSCNGDSGGPLIVKKDSPQEDVQVGVVSWGFGCAHKKFPGVYARITSAYEWIEEKVKEKGESLRTASGDGSGPSPGPSPTTKPPVIPHPPPTTPTDCSKAQDKKVCRETDGCVWGKNPEGDGKICMEETPEPTTSSPTAAPPVTEPPVVIVPTTQPPVLTPEPTSEPTLKPKPTNPYCGTQNCQKAMTGPWCNSSRNNCRQCAGKWCIPRDPTPPPEVPTPPPEVPTPSPEVPTPSPEVPTPSPEVPNPSPEVPTTCSEAQDKQTCRGIDGCVWGKNPEAKGKICMKSETPDPTTKPPVSTAVPGPSTPSPEVPNPSPEVPTTCSEAQDKQTCRGIDGCVWGKNPEAEGKICMKSETPDPTTKPPTKPPVPTTAPGPSTPSPNGPPPSCQRSAASTRVADTQPVPHVDSLSFDATFIDETRIIGGTEAPKGRFPYMVNIANKDGEVFCGGSLISPSVVLCAAHCAKTIEKVYIGRHDLQDGKEDFQEIDVDKIIPHPKYKKGTSENDFLILTLKQKASKAFPVVLDRPGSSDGVDLPLSSGSMMLNVMGWGFTTEDDPFAPAELSPKLMEVAVAYIPNTVCSPIYFGTMIFDNMICAASPGKDSCQGDSGGPLIVKRGSAEEDVQVGVVSWGFGCADEKYPGVYARVSTAFDWIKGEVEKQGESLVEPCT